MERDSFPVRHWAETHNVPLDVAYCAADGLLCVTRNEAPRYWGAWGLSRLSHLSSHRIGNPNYLRAGLLNSLLLHGALRTEEGGTPA